MPARPIFCYNAKEVQQNDLFVDDLSARFDDLRGVMHELDAMRDTTAEEVEQSKALWKGTIAPKLNLLSRALSFVCTRRALLAEDKRDECEALSKTPDIVKQLFDAAPTETAALELIEAYAARYRFFHFEVAFPEAFAGGKKGFDSSWATRRGTRPSFRTPTFFRSTTATTAP